VNAPARPRPILASFAAAAVWILPWIIGAVLFAPSDPHASMGLGILLFMSPLALLVCAIVWRIVGGLSRGGEPTLPRFMTRTTLVMVAITLLLQFGLLWAGDGPRQPDGFSFALVSGLALGIASLPAAAAWWHLAVRPAIPDPASGARPVLGATRDAGLALALDNVVATLRAHGAGVNEDIRLDQLAPGFEAGGATRPDVERALALLFERRWLVPNLNSGVARGGHCLTAAGVAAIHASAPPAATSEAG
jgi:hypothetical protein